VFHTEMDIQPGASMVPKEDYDNLQTSYEELSNLVSRQQSTIDNLNSEVNDLKAKKFDLQKKIMKLQADTKKIAFAEVERKPLPPKPGQGIPLSPSQTPQLPRPPSAMTLPVTASTFSLEPSMSPSTLSQRERAKPNEEKKSKPELEKYEKMKKIGMPLQSIINKM
ncbi:hypothetical protein RFI_12316, partial [Reticulomyxa filosa]